MKEKKSIKQRFLERFWNEDIKYFFKIIIGIVILSAIIIMIFFGISSAKNHYDYEKSNINIDEEFILIGNLIIDKKTGVEYIRGNGGVYPRLNSDGSLYLYNTPIK